MRKFKSMNLLFSLMLICAFSTSFSTSYGESEIFKETQDKLDNISDEEKNILKDLYAMEQEIQETEKEEKKITNQIEEYKIEINNLENKIKEDESSFEKNRDVLKEVLKSYQRMGPGSFLEVLLTSDNLGAFLRTLNTLKDLSRNTEELMTSLDKSKAALIIQKNNLAEKLLGLEDKKEALKLVINEKNKIKNEKENYLSSLKEEREVYQDFLLDITKSWKELKPLFKEATAEFTRLANEGNLPPDAVEVSISRFNVKGTIKEASFNNIILEYSRFPKVEFKFKQGKINVHIPDLKLLLTGNFIVEGNNTLKFIIEEGSFYDLPLEKASIAELLEEGHLLLNLEPLIGSSKVEEVNSQAGYIELIIKAKLY